MAAMGRQLKQSVKVFHNLMLKRRLPVGKRGILKKIIASKHINFSYVGITEWYGGLEDLGWTYIRHRTRRFC